MKPQTTKSGTAKSMLEQRSYLVENTRTAEAHRERVCPDKNRLGAIYALDQVSGFGPVKFRTMYESGIDAQSAIEDPSLLPFNGRTGEKLRRSIDALSKEDLAAANAKAIEQLERAGKFSASILVHGDSDYPERVLASNNPVPVLYVRGDPAIWRAARSVAVVGSREIREPYSERTREFSLAALREGIVIVSGFALGADSIGHIMAFQAGGRTICVMPCGLDSVFPPENRDLWAKLLRNPKATFVSEFGFGLRASSLSLRKRNKLIVAFSQGILVTQSAIDGGAMNAFRCGREQKKPVATFKPDGSKETLGNAMIAQANLTGTCAFESNCTDPGYQSWLQRVTP